jgi:arsenate reductase (thioredoxin)
MELPLRVLVLCTANSARSQIAQALFSLRGGGRIDVESAGTTPAAEVNPGALRVLADHGIPTEAQRPKGVDDVAGLGWDVVITVCDQAKEACPILPGVPVSAHWGVPDPVGAVDEVEAFERAFEVLGRRVDDFLALPLETLSRDALKEALDRIGSV